MKSCFCCKFTVIAVAIVAALIAFFLLPATSIALLASSVFFALTGATAIVVIAASLLSIALSPRCPIGCCRQFGVLATLGAVGILLSVIAASLVPLTSILALQILVTLIIFFLFITLGGLLVFMNCYNPCKC